VIRNHVRENSARSPQWFDSAHQADILAAFDTVLAAGLHERPHAHGHGHGHSHGLVDLSIQRSRAGLKAVGWSLLVLALTAGAQAIVFLSTGSVALLADLIHNVGDALTAVPLAIAFLLRSARAERGAGYIVVAVIFFSACVAAFQAVDRLINPQEIDHLLALGLAGAVGIALLATAAVVFAGGAAASLRRRSAAAG
jgi:Co/Zn/Cd efflux system component